MVEQPAVNRRVESSNLSRGAFWTVVRTKPSGVNKNGAIPAGGNSSVFRFRAGSVVVWPTVAAAEIEAVVGPDFREQPHGVGSRPGVRVNRAEFHYLDVVLEDLHPFFRRRGIEQ